MTYAVANTKGGVGKTLIGTNGLPSLFIGEGKEIKIYELDNNNKTGKSFSSSKLTFQTYTVEGGKEKVYKISFEQLKGDSNIVNIIDAGGGDDSLDVISQIAAAGIDDITYVIPTNSSRKEVGNVEATMKAILSFDENAKIFLILNGCASSDTEEIENQFSGYYGHKKYGLIPLFDESLKEKLAGILFFPHSVLFALIEDIHEQTLSDIYPKSKSFVENFNQLRMDWLEKGEDYYMKQMYFKEFATDIVELFESIDLDALKGE